MEAISQSPIGYDLVDSSTSKLPTQVKKKKKQRKKDEFDLGCIPEPVIEIFGAKCPDQEPAAASCSVVTSKENSEEMSEK